MGNTLYILVTIFNYFHDLAVAVMACSILAVYFFGEICRDRDIRSEALPRLFAKFSRVTYTALAFIIAGGFVRAYFFMDLEWNPAAGKGQIAALIVKHVLLVSVTIWGIIIHRRYVRKFRNNE